MIVIHDDGVGGGGGGGGCGGGGGGDDDRASKFLLHVSIIYLTLQRHIPEGACGLNQCCENLDLIMNVVC